METPTPTQYIPTRNDIINNQIEDALATDLNTFPGIHRNTPNLQIDRTKARQDSPHERMITLLTIMRWGYNSLDRSYNEKIRIVMAASRLIAYDNGYSKAFSVRAVLRWQEDIDTQIITGTNSQMIGCNKHNGSISYVESIESTHPGYMHYLFRSSLEIKGANSSFEEIAHQMNYLSRVPNEERIDVSLNRKHITNWFESNHGKLISPLEKPLDSKEHCALRIDWVVKYYGILTNPYLPVCYIDEKWFYCVNRRKKIKILPKGKNESDKVSLPKKQKCYHVASL